MEEFFSFWQAWMESYVGNNSCRIDKAPIENYDMYILRFDDTTPFTSPQDLFWKQKQYIIDINPFPNRVSPKKVIAPKLRVNIKYCFFLWVELTLQQQVLL